MKKTLIICLILIEGLFIFLAYTSFNNKDTFLDDVKLKETNITNKKSYAIMIEQSDGTYAESQSTTFPTDMVFNSTKSGCIDENDNLIPNSLSYQNNKVMITTNKTAYCYVYFDIDNSVTAYIPRLFTSTNDTSKISKYTGPVTDECSANSCTTVQQAQNVYIFKSNDVNNIIFEGYCWKIIRTTETRGIKLLYNGTPITVSDHEECVANNGVNAMLTAAQMNTANNTINYSQGGVYDKPAYVGYMYNPNTLTGTYGDQLRGDNINTTDSYLKEKIEYWFSNSNIDEDKLEDAVYCNDRSLATSGTYISPTTEADLATATSGDIYFKNYISQSTLECSNETDSFNTTNTKAQTNYKVGFMTEAERYLMTANDTNYSTANNSIGYWLGSPSNFFGGDAYVRYASANGSGNGNVVDVAYGVRPAVSVGTGVQIIDGEGSTTSPFIAS